MRDLKHKKIMDEVKQAAEKQAEKQKVEKIPEPEKLEGVPKRELPSVVVKKDEGFFAKFLTFLKEGTRASNLTLSMFNTALTPDKEAVKTAKRLEHGLNEGKLHGPEELSWG